jgi:hypothetical protein
MRCVIREVNSDELGYEMEKIAEEVRDQAQAERLITLSRMLNLDTQWISVHVYWRLAKLGHEIAALGYHQLSGQLQ